MTLTLTDHSAFEHFVCNRSGYSVDKRAPHLRIIAQQLNGPLHLWKRGLTPLGR